jgi:hypothetical protein
MRRILALVTVASALAFAAPAQAKPFTYSDAKGDMPANAGLDIVGVTYSTEGTTTVTKVRGRKVTSYEPTRLVATLTLAGAPVTQPGVKYRVESEVEGCGTLSFVYAVSAQSTLVLSQGSLACGGAAGTTGGDTLFFDPKFTVKGSKLIWNVPLKALPKNARAGALLYKFAASVDLTDPAVGTLGPDDFGSGVLDTASSNGDWEIA